jgi:hypothetical protein
MVKRQSLSRTEVQWDMVVKQLKLLEVHMVKKQSLSRTGVQWDMGVNK